MKKLFAGTAVLLLIMLGLAVCGPVGEKSVSLTVIYGAAAILSLLLLIGYFCLKLRRDPWFILLFSSVLVVNVGYFCLAVSSTLSEALLANRISYLGSVLLPMSMFLVILNVTGTRYPRYLPWVLMGVCVPVFFVAASPGYLDIYYKEVSFAVVNSVAVLVKVYGPWHFLYLFYLFAYFAAMAAVIAHAAAVKAIDTTLHAVILAMAGLTNLGVWLIEQLVNIEFEMLSISYIISELFLLSVHLVIHENRQLKERARQTEQAGPPRPVAAPPADEEAQSDDSEALLRALADLTPRERALFDAYMAGDSTKDIMAAMHITENTLKFHSRNLYGKLAVTSRKQMESRYRSVYAPGRQG
ncbi:histidine kinase N-terminal 7TM domain-containing protein [Dysosmobacter sp.]|uniref:histidine kinase N-terminal 7TM domain-containing protein n=1 Tax=Dysosmobacter sp. TaxID=2591382 RepID=UPI002A84AB26|nr:histidine kinase N-terminal 7TM domain-containing protein [Dysosmobacter sp.]MDY3281244.1 histidine kinase N-terminal 7TM domain-containing protein [Dysosmobacter sp.]